MGHQLLGFVAATAMTVLMAGPATAAAADDANAGEAALNRNDYNTAIEMFTRAIASGGLSPADAESAYVERAKAYIGLGNGAAAQSDLNQAQRLNPTDPEIAALQAEAQSSSGAHSVAPAPVTSQLAGPALAETMAFLVQAIAGQGTLHWSSTIHDPSGYVPDYKNRYSEEYSKLRADPLSCRIYYHYKATLDADVTSDIDMEISLSSILSVERISLEQSVAMFHAQTGITPTWKEVYDSSVAVVYMPKSLPAGTPAGPIAPFDEVTFIDPNLADRVANGFRHAAELCGAKQQPF